ncbi:MAG: diaminopimelate epimerase, partial [Eubacteriales bacterium]|nr:diaminopimelate epimerase [Eubacteriales bacterium]
MIFSKLNGLGNDFVITDDRENKYTENLDEMARKLCHRRTGIGADGLVFVRKSETCDVRMQIFNSDGSEAEMCGNGVRCFAKYVYDKGIFKHERMSVETLA